MLNVASFVLFERQNKPLVTYHFVHFSKIMSAIKIRVQLPRLLFFLTKYTYVKVIS